MGTRERKLAILQYLADREVAMPPSLLHANMRHDRFIPFSPRTTRRMLRQLHDEGLVEREEWEGGSYRITPAGREWLADELGE